MNERERRSPDEWNQTVERNRVNDDQTRGYRDGAQLSELEWLAFQYLCGELSHEEEAAFEKRLLEDPRPETLTGETLTGGDALQRMVLLLEQLGELRPAKQGRVTAERQPRRQLPLGETETGWLATGWLNFQIGCTVAGLVGLGLFGWWAWNSAGDANQSRSAGQGGAATIAATAIGSGTNTAEADPAGSRAVPGASELEAAIAFTWADQGSGGGAVEPGAPNDEAEWTLAADSGEVAPTGDVTEEESEDDWLLAALISLDELQTWPGEGQGDGT